MSRTSIYNRTPGRQDNPVAIAVLFSSIACTALVLYFFGNSEFDIGTPSDPKNILITALLGLIVFESTRQYYGNSCPREGEAAYA